MEKRHWASEHGKVVSVVVPSHDSARTLEACLVSVRSQSYRPIELIVVDNHSSDLTVEIARQHADIVAIAGPERSAQRNHGASLGSGGYLLFVDSDMVLSREVVAECVVAAQTTGARGVIVPEISAGSGFLARCRAFERSFYVGDDSIEAARFFPRSAFQEVGGFDEGLDAMEDWDLSTRIARGLRLPRTNAVITHDEGSLRLSAVLAKKRKYAASSGRYWHKHGIATLRQANLVFRPAFFRNWRRLARHPALAAGMLSLKGLETIAAVSGVAGAQARELSHAWRRRRP